MHSHHALRVLQPGRHLADGQGRGVRDDDGGRADERCQLVEQGSESEEDEFGNDIPTSLENMLDPQGTTGPLISWGINSFVV